eukprot:gene10752-12721_t
MSCVVHARGSSRGRARLSAPSTHGDSAFKIEFMPRRNSSEISAYVTVEIRVPSSSSPLSREHVLREVAMWRTVHLNEHLKDAEKTTLHLRTLADAYRARPVKWWSKLCFLAECGLRWLAMHHAPAADAVSEIAETSGDAELRENPADASGGALYCEWDLEAEVRACATSRRVTEDDNDDDVERAISVDGGEKNRDAQLSFALLTFLAGAGLDANGEAWALLSFTMVTMCAKHLGPPRLFSTGRALRAGGALGVTCSATNALDREMRKRCATDAETRRLKVGREDPTMIECLHCWCRKQLSHPIADELYHSSVELKLATTNVPTLWREATVEEDADDDTQSGSAFDRNPATVTLGRANAEGADDARNTARACVEAFHATSVETEKAWHAEFAVSALNYVCMQTCELCWFARFFFDAELDAVHALFRVRAYRCTAVKYAPAVVRVRRVWYLLFPRDGNGECYGADEDGGGWRAIAAWCVYVREKLRDAPCRGVNLRSVLDDIESSSSDGG